jgi:hypothetical protein
MSDMDDDWESQPDERDDSPRALAHDEKQLEEWVNRFGALDWPRQDLWKKTHHSTTEWVGDFLEGIYLEPLTGTESVYPTNDPVFDEFLEFNETVRRKLKRLDDYQRGLRLDQIEDDNRCRYLLDGTIPTNEVSLLYGRQKAGKSSWVHKLSICVASPGMDFEGEPIAHGRALLVTLDSGARGRNVKPRILSICERLGVRPPGENLIIVDDAVILDDPASVAGLLRKNPGEFALVVIDPLFKALSGDASRADIMNAATEGMKTIARETGAAVLVLHHQGRADESRPFGSVFLDAAVDSIIHITRKADRVTVKVKELKNGEPRAAPFVYDLQGPYLHHIQGAPSIVPDTSPTKVPYPELLALVPGAPIPIRAARKLLEHLLTGEPDARRKQWQRIRHAWAEAGLIAQDTVTIRRIVKVTP